MRSENLKTTAVEGGSQRFGEQNTVINSLVLDGRPGTSHNLAKHLRRERLRIGLAFNEKPAPEPSAKPSTCRAGTRETQGQVFDDSYAEWDESTTIAAVEDALAEVGEVVRLEAKKDFPFRLYEARPDIVFNIAEGLWGPNREAYVPAFCEFWEIPYVGSDPLSLSTCLHKGRAKEVLMRCGVRTPEFKVISCAEEVSR